MKRMIDDYKFQTVQKADGDFKEIKINTKFEILEEVEDD